MESLMGHLISHQITAVHVCLVKRFDNMEDILKWLKRHSNYDIYSFDVFDTLLRRRIDPPEVVKQLVAEHMSELLARSETRISPQEIATQRRRVEEALWKEAQAEGKDADYHLDDVVAGTLRSSKVDHVLSREHMVDYEIGLEKKATQLMPGAPEVLGYLKSTGKRVICISDSYLSVEQMSAILEHHGLRKYIDKLFVSSDIGKRKSTGRLFRHIIEKEGKNIVHIGDNYDSDYIVPGKLGMKALWFHSGSEQLRKKELRELFNSENKMDYVNTIIRSPARYKSGLQRVGYEVLGPALTVFVHNVAEQARKDNIEALFFVARDGYAMKKIYETLQRTIYAESGLLPGKYMCLGRLPVRLASLHELNYAQIMDAYAYIARFPERGVNLKDILGSYGLKPDRFSDIARQYGLDLNEPITNPARDERLPKLVESNELKGIVRRESAQARDLLRDYLAGIGFMGKNKVAVVDANAEGLTQSILDMIFSDDADYPVVSRYYFNLVTINVKGGTGINPDLSQVTGIVSDWRRGSGNERKSSLLLGMLIELFAHPNHGVTVGYRNVDGQILPVFRKTPQESQYPLTSQGLQGILSYAHDYGMYHRLHNYDCEQLLEHMKDNIKRWVLNPPKKDVEALKELFLTSDWPIESNHRLIGQIKGWDIVTTTGLRRKVRDSWWPEATLISAPIPVLSKLSYRMSSFVDRGLQLLSHFT
ncbi:MAG: HAD-IA family hydrolase [Chloroflexi bacterium]|nr:HAD-IA family hydrolase [Chloroflexota bacterium]